MTLSPPHLVALRALLDRLIPADEFPGALAAGTEHYILKQLAGDCAAEVPRLLRGLELLDTETSLRHPEVKAYHALSTAQQDALLVELEAGRTVAAWPEDLSGTAFFSRFVELAHEGFYADPANGGNRDGASWAMLGYAPRTER